MLQILPSNVFSTFRRLQNVAKSAIFAFFFISSISLSAQSVSNPGPIQGNLCIDSGGTTLNVSGTTLNGNLQYQWGTGTTPGQNIFASGASATHQYVNPTTATTYWVRMIRTNNSQVSSASFATVVIKSIAPTHIQWVAPICPNSNVTLNALGGSNGTNGQFQWGSGSVGSNIIAGATTSSIIVSPSSTTTYWARRTDGAPCNSVTSPVHITVTVISSATAPTTLTSNAVLPLCQSGGGTTLAAGGGTGSSDSVFQWGTGTVIGSNILAGQTNSTMYVNPTSSTTYWVRRLQSSQCNSATAGVSLLVSVATRSVTPTSISGSNTVCSGNAITLTAFGGILAPGGMYQWGTGYSVGQNIIAGANSSTLTVNPTSQTVYWVRTIDAAPCYISWMQGPTKVISIASSSTAPTSINGAPLTQCGISTFTLTASGGSATSGATYQWGTGEVGQNIIMGTGNSITVTANATTVYWVRRFDSACGSYTSAATKTVIISPGTVSGTLLSAETTICKNTLPNNISIVGNVGQIVKWQSSTNSNFTGSIQDIASTSTTLLGSEMGTAVSTKYYRAVVQLSGCNVVYTNPIAIIVPPLVVYSGSWNGEITAASSIRISQNLTLPSNLSVCSCEVVGNATLTIPENTTLTVYGSIEVNPSAEVIVENNGSLIQIDNNATNSGSITVKRDSKPMKLYDYTYWSAPVQNVTLAQLSPNTLFDKYYSYNPIANAWAMESQNTVMSPSKGYIVRAPQGWSLTNSTNGVYTGVFTGQPNNGVISTQIQKGSGTLNLIGNPYPSAIDIDLFLSDPTNAALLKGTIYLWTHNTPIAPVAGVVGLQYSAADYAKYNLTGSVKTATAALTGNILPTGKIASGQSFFIEAKPTLATGTYNAVFNNSMRIAQNNDQFFRSSTPANKDRLWLSLSNDSGAYNEILVGYVAGATNELDDLYDGKTFAAGNSVSLYTILGSEQLSIQGRALPFVASEVIPMGFSVTNAGTFSIAIDHLEGVFESQNVYLFDKQNSTSHDLKLGAYSFITTTGTFNDRFEIRFITNSLTTTAFDVANFSIAVQNNTININSGVSPMSAVTIYDLRGRLVFTSKVTSTLFSTPNLNMNNEVLVVSVTFENGATESRKVLVQ